MIKLSELATGVRISLPGMENDQAATYAHGVVQGVFPVAHEDGTITGDIRIKWDGPFEWENANGIEMDLQDVLKRYVLLTEEHACFATSNL